MTELIVCSKCNTQNRSTARFCATCGATLPAASAAATEPLEFVQLSTGRVMNHRYTITRPLGKGGMGAVYLASETIANRQRQVVVKEMLEYYDAGDPEGEEKARQRFESEAATLVSLNFSGIPQIFDYFSDGGRNYIVMQFIEGRNLEIGLTHLDDEANMIEGAPYAVEKVRQWGIQVCKVLENLAALNIVHMDIKPPNLIQDKSGDVWLVDFGTAKAQWVAQATGRLGIQKSSVYGTVGYAPAEQYTGKAEPRSDVYALAATMYHLLTDDDPRQHPFKFPMLEELPTDIASALQSALNQDVSQRANATEFRQMLEVRATGKMPFRWQDGTISYDPRELVVPADRHWEEALRYFAGDAWETWFRALHRNDILSGLEDAKRKHANPNQALDAFLRKLDPKYPRPQLKTGQIALSAGTVRRDSQVDLDLELQNGGAGWLQGRFVELPTWIEIHKGTSEQALQTKNMLGQKTAGQPLTEFGFRDHLALKVNVSPGRLAARLTPYISQFAVDAGEAGKLQIPVEVNVRPARFVNSALGRVLMALFALLVVCLALVWTDTHWLGWVTIRLDPLVQGTPRYGILFTSNRTGKREIYRMSAAGVLQVTRTPGKGESWSPTPDPENGGVLFVSNRDGKREIYRLGDAGTVRVTKTPGDGESWEPFPAPGGILFTSNRDGKREIYRILSDGTTERVTNTPGDAESWSPVMTWKREILFVSNRDGKSEIYRLAASGLERLTNSPGSSESLAPVPELNGDILFLSNRDGVWDVYHMNGSNIERLTNTPAGSESGAAFPELGGNVLFTSNRDGKWEIYRLIGGQTQRVTMTSGQGESWLAERIALKKE